MYLAELSSPAFCTFQSSGERYHVPTTFREAPAPPSRF
jgi:hypothetical protein